MLGFLFNYSFHSVASSLHLSVVEERGYFDWYSYVSLS